MIEVLVFVAGGATVLLAIDIFEEIQTLRKNNSTFNLTTAISLIYRGVGFIFGLVIVFAVVAMG